MAFKLKQGRLLEKQVERLFKRAGFNVEPQKSSLSYVTAGD